MKNTQNNDFDLIPAVEAIKKRHSNNSGNHVKMMIFLIANLFILEICREIVLKQRRVLRTTLYHSFSCGKVIKVNLNLVQNALLHLQASGRPKVVQSTLLHLQASG